MRYFKHIVAGALAGAMILPPAPLLANTRKGDKLRNQARAEEVKGNFDKALELAEQTLQTDPSDPAYMLQMRRIRFEAGLIHVKNGQQLRAAGKVEESLVEFQKAYATDPSSDVAAQEIRRTKEMIERNKNGGQKPDGPGSEIAKLSRTPSEQSRFESQQRTESLMPVPELKPLNPDLIDLKMTNRPRVLFETVGKVAGLNVLFDAEYNQQQTIATSSIDLSRTTIDQALDQIALITKSFWKPLSPNTIFVTVDNPTKRREYAEQVVKVFYLSNATTPQEIQEMLTVLRTVVDVQKVFNYTAQNALIVRAEADTMALVEKLISDLDKPRAEVIVDVMVMEVSSSYMRKLTAALAPTGINTMGVFTPRPGILTPSSTTSGTSSSTTSSTTTTGTTTGTSATGTSTSGSTSIPIENLGRISSADFSLTSLPGATFEAVLNDSSTRLLQAPQIRAAANAKASIKIGDKVPTATGSFQPGVGSVGVSPLVNTQFTFIDVGVNVEITPQVHDNNEVSMHVDLDVSQVKDRIDIGGISQPEITQNKSVADIRLREGEVNIIGGIMQQTNSKANTGLPGLGKIPILGRLFSGETVQRDHTELVIALVPHIVRGIDVTESNLKGVAAGNATQIKVNYAPRKVAADGPAVPAGTPGAPPATAPPIVPGAPPVTAPPATAPPATAPPATAPPATAPIPVPPPPPAANPAAAAATPAGPVRVTFLPPSVEAELGSAVTVTLYAENLTDLATAVARMKFDPAIVRVNNIIAGDLARRNAATAAQPTRNILNDAGIADFSISRGADAGGVSGSGGLFSIVLQAMGRGETTIQVDALSLATVSGQAIPVTLPDFLKLTVR